MLWRTPSAVVVSSRVRRSEPGRSQLPRDGLPDPRPCPRDALADQVEPRERLALILRRHLRVDRQGGSRRQLVRPTAAAMSSSSTTPGTVGRRQGAAAHRADRGGAARRRGAGARRGVRGRARRYARPHPRADDRAIRRGRRRGPGAAHHGALASAAASATPAPREEERFHEANQCPPGDASPPLANQSPLRRT